MIFKVAVIFQFILKLLPLNKSNVFLFFLFENKEEVFHWRIYPSLWTVKKNTAISEQLSVTLIKYPRSGSLPSSITSAHSFDKRVFGKT